MADPMAEIENRKAQRDMGAMAFWMYKGAREEGASFFEGFMVLVAYFRGMFGSHSDVEDNDEEKDSE